MGRPILSALLALAVLIAPGVAGAAPTVVLISLDGTRPDDLAPELPALSRIAREGARAERMIPEFPTNTFPNHVTLVTGVSPERHGIVNNTFVDPERGRYAYESDPTWLEAEPLWSILEGAGIPTASYYWVGSEGPWRNGRGPRHWKPFNSRTATAEKIDGILAWLALPEPERPRFISAWLHGADGAGHRHGPGAPETRDALREQDAELARLLAAIDSGSGWQETTVIVVSDHGMHPIEDAVNLQGLLDDQGIGGRVHGGGGFVTITLDDAGRDRARALETARAAGLEAWPRGEGPPGMEARHARFGDLVALAPPGTTVRRSGIVGRIRAVFTGGGHGYRPSEPSMASIFLAMGRGVAPGLAAGEVRARDVAPTVLALLGLPIPDSMQGQPIGLRPPTEPEEEIR